jgi:tetrahydromethanopterin S-methyltransferase subunit A
LILKSLQNSPKLFQVAIESGTGLAGTLQTENICIEKVIANVVANPNVRYIVLC